PASTVEPEWPRTPEPPRRHDEIAAARQAAVTYRPPTAPAVPSEHVPHILAAARAAEVDPALLAATAARESTVGPRAYREAPQLPYVLWRAAPGGPADRFPDGSIGPCQILRSNLRGWGIDNDRDGYDAAANYRTGALIVRANIAAFPDDRWR